jgi:hypothetical protein
LRREPRSLQSPKIASFQTTPLSEAEPAMRETLSDEDYIEAGRSAVVLLKALIDLIPLRSDAPKIRDEIARLEKIFWQEAEG